MRNDLQQYHGRAPNFLIPFFAAVALAVLIVVGACASIRSTLSEPTLLGGCFAPMGHIEYGSTDRCEPIRWGRYPLYVASTDSDLVAPALEFWNASLGQRVFVQSTGARIDVLIEVQAYAGETAGRGETSHMSVNGVLFSEIKLYGLRPGTEAKYWVLAHELGHALGLAHDGDYRSIMFPVSRGPGRVTRADREVLRRD